MYPDRELIRLAIHKTAVRRRIAVRRALCVEAAGRVTRPVVLLDRAVVFWRRLPLLTKCVAVPLAIVVARTVSRRLKTLRLLVRWGPLLFAAVRIVSSGVKTRAPVLPNSQATLPDPCYGGNEVKHGKRLPIRDAAA